MTTSLLEQISKAIDPSTEKKEKKSYSDLPGRKILKNPFLTRPFVSYGIIAYTPKSQKWLLVRRSRSPSFILTIRGSYRLSDLPDLVQHYTKEEVETIRDLIDRKISFREVFSMTIGNGDHIYAETRFQESIPLLNRCLPLSSNISEPEWLWPKGRISGSNESPFQCAIREFTEETGIALPSSLSLNPTDFENQPYLVSESILSDSSEGINGRIYQTHCWVVIFPFEIDPPPPVLPGEIGVCRWVSEKEAKEILQPHKYQILKEAQMLIDDLIVHSK
jgi:8-oxo-dGTP pyrophosphatase MutT (NUDIX family)